LNFNYYFFEKKIKKLFSSYKSLRSLVHLIDIMVSTQLFTLLVICLLVATVFCNPQVCGNTAATTTLASPSDVQIEQKACVNCEAARLKVEAQKAVHCQLTCPTLKQTGCSKNAFIVTLPSFNDQKTIQNYNTCVIQSQNIGVKSCLCKNLSSGLNPMQKLQLLFSFIKACGCQQSPSTKKKILAVQSIETLETKAVELESKALDLENSATALEME
jgi:cell division protein FtsL